jgi:hypothetical protein
MSASFIDGYLARDRYSYGGYKHAEGSIAVAISGVSVIKETTLVLNDYVCMRSIKGLKMMEDNREHLPS